MFSFNVSCRTCVFEQYSFGCTIHGTLIFKRALTFILQFNNSNVFKLLLVPSHVTDRTVMPISANFIIASYIICDCNVDGILLITKKAIGHLNFVV